MSPRRDDKTLDLFTEWTPPAVAVRFDARRVLAVPLSQRISRLVAQTLRECTTPRAEIAQQLSEFLGEDVSENMLDRYASEADGTHNITLYRALGLLKVTEDVRLLGSELEPLGYAVIPAKYLAAIRDAMYQDAMEQLKRQQRVERAKWKGTP